MGQEQKRRQRYRRKAEKPLRGSWSGQKWAIKREILEAQSVTLLFSWIWSRKEKSRATEWVYNGALLRKESWRGGSDGMRLRCLKSALDVLVELSARYLKGNARELTESVKFGAIRKKGRQRKVSHVWR